MAQQYDINHHPDLAHERNVLGDKSQEIRECERTASNIPLENRTMVDVKFQEQELRKLRKEEAVLEAALQQKAKSLGLGWPDDWGSPKPKRRGRRPKAVTPAPTPEPVSEQVATVADVAPAAPELVSEQLATVADLAPAAPPRPPRRKYKGKQAKLEEVLDALRVAGTDIESPKSVKVLQGLMLKPAGMDEAGATTRTIERARAAVLARISDH